jgi:hypothetical protein
VEILVAACTKSFHATCWVSRVTMNCNCDTCGMVSVISESWALREKVCSDSAATRPAVAPARVYSGQPLS